METLPFEFVSQEDQPGVWYAWPWEFAYLVERGESEDSAIAKAKSSLDLELDRREAVDGQYKFKPDQWPPPLKQIHERIQRDKERRKLPLSTRSYSAWLDVYPIELPDQCLTLDASDSEIADMLQGWAGLICAGRFNDAFRAIPDASTILPMSDFPQPQPTLTAEMLRSMFDDASVKTPFDRVEISEPTVSRVNRPATPREIGQRLVCGLGEVVIFASYSIALSTSEHALEVEIHGFSTDLGMSPTLRRLELKWADEIR